MRMGFLYGEVYQGFKILLLLVSIEFVRVISGL